MNPKHGIKGKIYYLYEGAAGMKRKQVDKKRDIAGASKKLSVC